MKKHELIKFAYDNYPKGAKFIQHGHSMVNVASGNYDVNNVTVYDVELDVALYIYNDEHEKWAKIVSDRKPLIISEDGVPLYEGEEYHEALLDDGSFRYCKGSNHFLNLEARVITIPNESKAFSSKQAALDWIEAQKPVETILFEGGTVRVKVDANGFRCIAESDERTFKFSGEELKQIYNAWQEHLPF